MSTSKAKKAVQAAQPAQVVYCGPTIPGVAKQFTVYQDGVPEPLTRAMESIPALRGLVVAVDVLPAALKQLRTGTGSIYTLYCQVQKSIRR